MDGLCQTGSKRSRGLAALPLVHLFVQLSGREVWYTTVGFRPLSDIAD